MRLRQPLFLVFFLAVLAVPACAQQDAPPKDTPVHSMFSGVLTVSPEIDSTRDYRDFEVLVAVDNEGEPDTLGYAVTDSTGTFTMEVTAPTRGRYSLVISRRGQILTLGALAVADGDTATVRGEFPMGNRPLRIRSVENSAWMAYENTMTQHRNRLLELVQSGEYTEAMATNMVRQSSTILWQMRETFAETMGAEAAAAEAVSMTVGWDDSLALARAWEIPPENIRYVEVAQAARNAAARLNGQQAALDLLESFLENATTDLDRRTLEFEIIVAHLDSSRYDVALTKARAFEEKYAGTDYEEWGNRAVYELENLIPGKEAPLFAIRDVAGDSLRLDDLRGQTVLIEFYHPQDDGYERELEGRNALIREVSGLEIISVSVAPDTLITEAFFDSRVIPGRHAINPSGLTLLYNINVVPTRFLIDSDGLIRAKYVGSTMAAIYEELVGPMQ